MDPKDYYYNNFRADFAEFMAKSKMAHKHPGEGFYIPIQDLNEDTVSHVKTDPWHSMRFLYCLAFTVFIDQVMYTYFKNEYAKFQSITLYPKIEYGISNMNARPWDIAQRAGGLTTFEKFAVFFVQDFKEFFEKQNSFCGSCKSGTPSNINISVSETIKIRDSLRNRKFGAGLKRN